LALGGGEWSVSHSGYFAPRETKPVKLAKLIINYSVKKGQSFRLKLFTYRLKWTHATGSAILLRNTERFLTTKIVAYTSWSGCRPQGCMGGVLRRNKIKTHLKENRVALEMCPTGTDLQTFELPARVTGSWSTCLIEKLIVVRLVKKFHAFYGTMRFISMSTRACNWSLS
jgi:hypothetical protein